MINTNKKFNSDNFNSKSKNKTYFKLINTCVNNGSAQAKQKTNSVLMKTTKLANADTGTTGHFVAIKDQSAIVDVMPVQEGEGIEVEQPDGSRIKSVATGKLKWDWLPTHLRTVHIFKDLTGSLLSIGLLCDAGYDVVFKKHTVTVTMKGVTVIAGTRVDRLWMLDMNEAGKVTLKDKEQESAAQMIVNSTQAEIVKYAHLSMGAPANPTFLTALKRGYIHPPGVTVEMARKKQHVTTATAKGHLNLNKQGLNSTKEKDTKEEQEFTFPAKAYKGKKSIIVTCKIFNTEDLQKMHVDLAGKFPYKSKRNKQYVAIFFSEEANYIHMELLASRTTADIVQAYKAAIEFFDQRNIAIKFIHLDGETSDALEKFIKKNQMKIQFAPSSNHRTLKAERSVQTAKNHIISSFCTTDPNFPMNEWDRLIPQIELTLNLMRGSAINPSISAWHQVHGLFKWTHTPIAPIGTKVLIHERSQDRKSWDPHGKDGFYIGPKLQHYRCYDILVTETGATRTSDTIAWYPQQCVMPGGSVLELFTEATRDLTTSIKNLANAPPGTTHNRSAISTLADTLANALRKYHDMFYKTSELPAETAEINEAASPDRHILQRVPTATEIVMDAGTDEVTDEKTSPDMSTLQRVPAAHRELGQQPKEAIELTQTQEHSTSGNRPTAKKQDRNKKSTPMRKAAAKQTAIAPVKTTSPHKGGQASTKQANRPIRAHKPITFADGITMSRPTTKVRGIRHVVKMAKEVARFNHQLKAIKATVKENKARVLNFRLAMHSDEHKEWQQANDEEFERLHSTETIRVVPKTQIPKDRKVAYYNPQVKVKTNSEGVTTYRVRGTIGGDKVDYPGFVAANTADLKTIKLLINSTISTRGAKFMTLDIKDFYLGTVLPRKEYMRISAKQMSAKYIQEHNLEGLCEEGYYYVEVSKGIYGLPQAGLLAQQKLIRLLKKHGYKMMPNTPCLFKHESKDVIFSLVVDDFGVKYSNEADAHQLINALQEEYKLHIDWTGNEYVGLALEWDYSKRTVAISMPGYVKKAIERFGAQAGVGANSPMIYEPPKYGEKIQYANPDEKELTSDTTKTKRLQQIVGVFLYYARAVDYSILTAVTTISTRQSKMTDRLMQAVERLLSYMKKYPDAKIIYHASNMQLITHADASYLCESGGKIQSGRNNVARRHGETNTSEWSSHMHLQDHRRGSCFRRRGRICRSIYFSTRSRSYSHNARRNGTQTTCHHYLLRQCMRSWYCKRHDQAETFESHRHAFSLGQGSRASWTFRHQMDQRSR